MLHRFIMCDELGSKGVTGWCPSLVYIPHFDTLFPSSPDPPPW